MTADLRKVAIVALILLCCVTSRPEAQQKTVAVVMGKIKPTLVPAQAVAYAHADLQTVPVHLRPYMRYLFVKVPTVENFQSTLLAGSYVSRNTVLFPPKAFPVVNKCLIRVDLQYYAIAANKKDLDEFTKVWEELQFDPDFSLLITKDMVRFLPVHDTPVKACYRDWQYVDGHISFDAGKTKGRWIRPLVVKDLTFAEIKVLLKDANVVKVIPSHFPVEQMLDLQLATQSLAPVVSYDYFVTRALTTIKDKGLFKEVFGGLYYDLAGVPKAGKKGTDEDALYEKLGIGNVEAGITAKEIFDRLRSDQRVAMFRSEVTGRPRRADWFHSLAGRDTIPFVFVTHDIKASSIDIGQHPIYNLLEFKDDAREVIWVNTNGTHGFSLYNNQGVRQDEVPPDIAADRTVPAPYHPRLQCAISCLRCHNVPEGTYGLQPLRNDVKTMQSGYASVYADLTNLNDLIPDTLDRIAGLYLGSPEISLMRARDDYAKSVLRCTGPWKDGGDQSFIVKQATEGVAGVYAKYNWGMIGAQEALYEIGFDVPKADAQKVLWMLLPPDVRSSDGVIIPEDPVFVALHSGVKVNRMDWAFKYSFAAERSQRSLERLRKAAEDERKEQEKKFTPKKKAA